MIFGNVSEELSSVETLTIRSCEIPVHRVSEELSSVETHSHIFPHLKGDSVSEELSSVETRNESISSLPCTIF